MALMSSWANLISTITPTNGTSDVPVDTRIIITFRIDMIPETINEGTVTLLNESLTKIPCTVTYQDRTATMVPLVALEPSVRYKLIISGGASGIKSVTAQVLGTDYNTNFTTAALIPPGKVSLSVPVDKSIFDALTEFRWELLPGILTYEIQISSESKFGSLLYSSIITGDSVIPDITFEHDEVYYWRVRAISNGATPLTGMWSDTRQFRYLIGNAGGGGVPGIPSTPNIQPLDVTMVIPEPEELFVNNINRITVRFSDNVDASTINSNTFLVKVDYLDLPGEPVVPTGYYTVTGNIVEFILGENTESTPTTPTVTNNNITLPITQNTIFHIELRKEIKAVNGALLVDDISWWFSTVLTPYYSKVEFVRNEIGELAAIFSDLEIAKMILSVSQWADFIAALPYGSVNEDYLGETQAEKTNAIFYHNYVRFETALRLLSVDTLQRLAHQGGTKQIGDLIIKDPMNLSADFKLLHSRLEAARNKAEFYLKMGLNTYPLPKSVVKGETSYAYPLNKRNSF